MIWRTSQRGLGGGGGGGIFGYWMPWWNNLDSWNKNWFLLVKRLRKRPIFGLEIGPRVLLSSNSQAYCICIKIMRQPKLNRMNREVHGRQNRMFMVDRSWRQIFSNFLNWLFWLWLSQFREKNILTTFSGGSYFKGLDNIGFVSIQ